MQASFYQSRISELVLDHDPRHIEAWMRISHQTLDHLTAAEFESEVMLAVLCIAESGLFESEELAKSYGL